RLWYTPRGWFPPWSRPRAFSRNQISYQFSNPFGQSHSETIVWAAVHSWRTSTYGILERHRAASVDPANDRALFAEAAGALLRRFGAARRAGTHHGQHHSPGCAAEPGVLRGTDGAT